MQPQPQRETTPETEQPQPQSPPTIQPPPQRETTPGTQQPQPPSPLNMQPQQQPETNTPKTFQYPQPNAFDVTPSTNSGNPGTRNWGTIPGPGVRDNKPSFSFPTPNGDSTTPGPQEIFPVVPNQGHGGSPSSDLPVTPVKPKPKQMTAFGRVDNYVASLPVPDVSDRESADTFYNQNFFGENYT
ncbi:hypothetical protein MMC07_001890 [Pseudocyphellaria aurata]|nr:hypothetical protein [Pseudocyphellaria aurata]